MTAADCCADRSLLTADRSLLNTYNSLFFCPLLNAHCVALDFVGDPEWATHVIIDVLTHALRFCLDGFQYRRDQRIYDLLSLKKVYVYACVCLLRQLMCCLMYLKFEPYQLLA